MAGPSSAPSRRHRTLDTRRRAIRTTPRRRPHQRRSPCAGDECGLFALRDRRARRLAASTASYRLGEKPSSGRGRERTTWLPAAAPVRLLRQGVARRTGRMALRWHASAAVHGSREAASAEFSAPQSTNLHLKTLSSEGTVIAIFRTIECTVPVIPVSAAEPRSRSSSPKAFNQLIGA